MQWIHRFQLFLFDFDGLLVNTEHIQYQAYVNALAQEGCKWDWSFAQFCETAHRNATALKDAICAQFPHLEARWPLLYQAKKDSYFELVGSGRVELMPGVEKLLRALEKANIERCVVTHSLLEQTKLLRSRLPCLQSLPHWITREDYFQPKPDPEGYLRAIALYGKSGDRIIGFEDSLRGLKALRQTPALPVLICPSHHPLLELAMEGGGLHFETLADIPNDFQVRRSTS